MIGRQNISDSRQDSIGCASSTARAGGGPNDRGVALVITLLLLFLLSIIGLAAVMSASSDLLINGYYNNYRGSFYGADSGINVARQAMYNQLNAGFTADFGTFVYPPPGGVDGLAATVQANILKYYGGQAPCPINPPGQASSTTCYLNAGTGANSWGESFTIINTSAHPTNLALATGFTNPVLTYSCVPTPGTTLGCPIVGYSSEVTSYKYYYNYTLSAVGSASGAEQSTITENGTLIIYVAGIPAVYNANYSIFGAFVTNWQPCTLGWLVPGTMTGTMFTDGSWGFGGGGGYIFTDPVGQADPDASYWVDGCNLSPNSSYKAPDGEVSDPQFQEGFAVNQKSIDQPTDSFSQEWAALDGAGCGEGGTACGGTTSPAAPTNANLDAYLKNINQSAYAGAPGVYLDYQNISGTLTVAGGGLVVQGNANSMLISAQTLTNGDLVQVYTITDQNGVTTTMTIDPYANSGTGLTVLKSGATTLNLMGVPTNCAALGGGTNLSASPPTYCTSLTPGSSPGTEIYVNGTIYNMHGPGEGVGAIQDGQAVTITALGDVNISGDVIYKTEPVTTTPNQIPGAPVATLIPGNDKNQDLGIFTANGNIILSSPYPDDNLQVDGSQAVIGNSCASWSCGFLVNGCINVFNNVGGQIQTNIFGACLNVENTYFDRRYTSRPGFAPPWFPATVITNTSSTTTTPPTLTLQRTSWVSSSGQ